MAKTHSVSPNNTVGRKNETRGKEHALVLIWCRILGGDDRERFCYLGKRHGARLQSGICCSNMACVLRFGLGDLQPAPNGVPLGEEPVTRGPCAVSFPWSWISVLTCTHPVLRVASSDRRSREPGARSWSDHSSQPRIWTNLLCAEASKPSAQPDTTSNDSMMPDFQSTSVVRRG